MTSLLWYALAALGEIGGCFAFWAWLRLHKSPILLIPGLAALIVFALALTRIDVASAGRAYAAYGGVFVVLSILWGWQVDKVAPDKFDVVGGIVTLGGVLIIMYAPRK